MNEGCKVQALMAVMKKRSLSMEVKEGFYERVVVSSEIYGEETW